MLSINWSELFSFSMSPLELIIRGSAVYWFIFFIFRLILRRDVGSIAIADVLLVVLIADAAQNAMAGEYKTISDGMVLISTIVFWNYAIDWLSFQFPVVERIMQPRPLCLIKNGEVQYRSLRREFISLDELMSKLREKNIERIDQVKSAYMESNGAISIIKNDD